MVFVFICHSCSFLCSFYQVFVSLAFCLLKLKQFAWSGICTKLLVEACFINIFFNFLETFFFVQTGAHENAIGWFFGVFTEYGVCFESLRYLSDKNSYPLMFIPCSSIEVLSYHSHVNQYFVSTTNCKFWTKEKPKFWNLTLATVLYFHIIYWQARLSLFRGAGDFLTFLLGYLFAFIFSCLICSLSWYDLICS